MASKSAFLAPAFQSSTYSKQNLVPFVQPVGCKNKNPGCYGMFPFYQKLGKNSYRSKEDQTKVKILDQLIDDLRFLHLWHLFSHAFIAIPMPCIISPASAPTWMVKLDAEIMLLESLKGMLSMRHPVSMYTLCHCIQDIGFWYISIYSFTWRTANVNIRTSQMHILSY